MIAATDDLLGVLKYALLALLYLFFARVLWAVWSEVRSPRGRADAANGGQPGVLTDPTVPTGGFIPVATPAATAARRTHGKERKPRAKRGKRGTVARLVIAEPRHRRGSAYPIGAEITIGRAETCTIAMPDDTFASQLHARVMSRDGNAWVEDLGSTNGTFVNGRRITAAEVLTAGDRLQVGKTTFEAS